MIELLLLGLIIEVGTLGYLFLRKLGSLESKIDSLRFDPHSLEDIKFTIRDKFDRINDMTIREAMKTYTRIQMIYSTYIEVVMKNLVDVVAAGVAKALGGRRR